MNTRFHSALLLATLLGAGAYRNANAQTPEAVLDLFENRSLKPHPLPSSGLPDPAKVKELEESRIGKIYNTIVPQRSLLISDCGAASRWCHEADFSFQAIMLESAKLANPAKPDADGVARGWFQAADGMDKTLTSAVSAFATVQTAPFQMLAIANRMDTAHVEGDQWVGAEMHFVYGLIPTATAHSAPELMVIMEFKLPSFDRTKFRLLAKTWQSLPDVNDAQYASKLLAALRASGLSAKADSPSRFISVSSRLNRVRTGAEWILSQLVLDPKSSDAAKRGGFVPTALADQIGESADPKSQIYLDLWKVPANPAESGALHIPIPDKLAAQAFQRYVAAGKGLGTPPGLCNATAARDVLGLQQCTLCHTAESGTVFKHVSNRLPAESSKLSGFLAGPDPTGATLHPKLADLYYRNPKMVLDVPLNYTTFSQGSDGTCTVPVTTTPTVHRYFHDVARRTLFLAAVLEDEPDKKTKQPKARRFSTTFIN